MSSLSPEFVKQVPNPYVWIYEENVYQMVQRELAPASKVIAAYVVDRGWFPRNFPLYSYIDETTDCTGDKCPGSFITRYMPGEIPERIEPTIVSSYDKGPLQTEYELKTILEGDTTIKAGAFFNSIPNENWIKQLHLNGLFLTEITRFLQWSFAFAARRDPMDPNHTIIGWGAQLTLSRPNVKGSTILYKDIVGAPPITGNDWPAGVPGPEVWRGFSQAKHDAVIRRMLNGDLSRITDPREYQRVLCSHFTS